MNLIIYRESDPNPVQVVTVTIDENTIYERELMGADLITVEVNVKETLPVQVNDYILYDNRPFFLTRAPEFEKLARNQFRYTLQFYGEAFLMYRKILRHQEVAQFSYTGTALDLLGLIVDNLQVQDISWSVGTVDQVEEPQTFTFTDQNCFTALRQVAEAFGFEYSITDKAIDLVNEIGSTQPLTFRYGKGNGLYEIRRTPNEENFATVWYGFGGNQNIGTDYRDNKGRLIFEERAVSRNTELYGVIEGVITFEDIYPKRTGTVTTVPADNQITDVDFDFDLNGQYLVDGSARIVFQSGALIGNEFIISSYDHATKLITFNANEEESGYIIPNDTVKAAINDTYVIVGIDLPESYVAAAETRLKTAVEAYAEENSNPKVTYDLEINELFILENNLKKALKPGDRIKVIDTDTGVNDDLRIRTVSYPLVNENQVTIVISEEETYTWQEQVVKQLAEVESSNTINEEAALYARRVADEIRQHVVLTKFERTTVGELAVLSGAFVAGNPIGGAVAGINGTGTTDTSVRFWAGSSYDDRATAPYRVLHSGKAVATNLEVLDGCKVGDFIVDQNGLKIGQVVDVGGTDHYDGILIDGDGIMNTRANMDGLKVGVNNNENAATHIRACLYGLNRETNNNIDTIPIIRAGLAGIAWDQMDDYLLQIRNSKGIYGAIFSSFKNLGAKYEAIRESSSNSSDFMTGNDYQVIAVPGCLGVFFPTDPDQGRTIEIKNTTGSNLPISVADTSDELIVLFDGAQVANWYILPHRNIGYRWESLSKKWYQLWE